MSDPFGQTPDLVGEIQAEKAYGPIYSSQYGDALKSARANELSRRLGIPPDIVEADIPNMMARDRLNRAVEQARQNQAYAKMMSNTRLAASAIDDHHLPAVASAVDTHRNYLDFGEQYRKHGLIGGTIASIAGGAAVLGGRILSGVTDIASSLSGVAHAASELDDETGFHPLGAGQFAGFPLAMRLFGQAHDAISKASDATRYTTSNRNFNDVASGVESIPTVATTVLGPEVPTALFGAQGFSDAYDEGRQAGLTPERSALYGVGDAAIMAGTSFLPEKYLGGALAGKGGIGKTIGTGIGLNETMTVLQGLNHWYFIDRPKGVTFDQFAASLPDQMRSSLVSTVAALGLTAGAGHIAARLASHSIDTEAAKNLDSVMEAAGKSSTRTANPSDFEAALNQLVGDSDASDIYVPADKVLELFQPHEGKAQRDLRSDPFWGQYAPQIEEAGTLGGDVVVPLSSAATHLAGSSDWNALRDFVRTRPGGASLAEIRDSGTQEDLEALASDIARKVDERVPQLKAQALTSEFASKLGYKGEQADAVSQLLGAGLSRAYALETAKRETAGEPVPMMEEFAQSYLPQAVKMTQAEYDATRAANTEEPIADAAQEAEIAPEQVVAEPEAPTEEPKTEPEQTKETKGAEAQLTDVGEKIGGARKDLWAQRGLALSDLESMSRGEAHQFVTKDNVWPKPDYAKMIEEGVPPEVAAAAKLLRDSLAAKPKEDNDEARRHYIEAMNIAREVLDGLKSGGDVREVQDRLYKALGVEAYSLARSDEERATRRRLFSIFKGSRASFSIGYNERRKIEQMLADGWPGKVEPWTRRFKVRQDYRGSDTERTWAVTNRKGVTVKDAEGNYVRGLPSKDAAEAKAKELYEGLNKNPDGTAKLPERPHLDNLERTGKDIRGGRDVKPEDFLTDFGFRGVEFGNWVANDERQKAVNLAYEGLHDLADTLGIPAETLSLGGQLGLAFGARGKGSALAHYEPGKLVINLTKLKGAGALAHEWGHALDHYFGTLDMDTGTRGAPKGVSGWHDPYRFSALGNLRPDLAKAFDGVMQALFRREKPRAEMVRDLELKIENVKAGIEKQEKLIETYRNRSSETGSEAYAKAFIAKSEQWIATQKNVVLKAFGKRLAELKDETAEVKPEKVESSYYKNAQALSGKSGKEGYWARPTEMFARAFESYVFDKIKERGNVSQYLVQGVEPDRYASEIYKGNPYPAGEERQSIVAAFDHLFETMGTRGIQEPREGGPTRTLFDAQRRGNISIVRDENDMMAGATIRAFEHADFSTVVHEIGHFFVEDLRRRALRSDATEQEQTDWETVKQWMGMADDNSIPEAAHERWARGFERYIYEGKAPAQGLKAVFAKMRDFMVSLYRSVRSFNSPITPEIRQVMDRLLASDDEINARREELRLGNQALSELMSAEEQTRYADLGDEARAEARDKLYDKVLSTLRAERTRAVASRKSEIRQELSDEADAQPIFRALKMLRSGRTEDGETTRVALPKQWLIDNYGEDILNRIPHDPKFAVNDGENAVDPESLAREADFDSADQMVQKLIAHEEERQKLKASGDNRSPRRALVEQATEQRVRDELGDPFDNLEEEADAALANEKQADRLSLELRALSRKTGKSPVPWKLAKDWAHAHVRSETVRDAARSVQGYSRAASKAAQTVEEALAGGDYEAAFRAKQQQVLNLALMAEAKAAKDETIKAAKRLRKVARAKNIASVDQTYLDQAHRLLENVDMKQRPEKAVDKRMAFEAWHAKQVEMEIDPVVPPEYQSILGNTHWTRLSVNDLLDLDKAVKQIVKLGRLKQELKDGQKKRDFNEAVSEMQDSGGRVPPRKVRGKTTDPRKSPVGRIASRLRSMDAAMVKTEQLAIWLDRHDPNGPWQRYLYRPMADAQGRQSDLSRQYGKDLNALIKAMPKSAVRALTRSVDTPELIIRNKNHLSNGDAWAGTKDQVLMMALNWGNLGNRQRLLDGFGWTEQAVANVFDRTLTKDDWDFVQGVWDTVDKLWPDVAKLEREVNGVEPEKVEAAEVPTPHGTYRGGYFPIVYDPMQTTHTAQVDEDKMAPSGGWWSVTTRSSATKERSEQVKGRPLNLSLGVITHHMNEVIHDITHRQAVNQAKRLLGDERVSATINKAMGPEYLKAARAWVENVAKPNNAYSRANPAVVWLARYLNKAITTVGLGFRVSVSLKQLLGIPFSAKDLGSDAIAKGMGIVLANPVAAYKEMTDRSAEMRARSDHLDASIDDMHQDLASGKLRAIGPRGIAKYAFKGIAYMDVVSRTTVWTSAYNKALEEGMSEDDAVAYGDRTVRQSHGIGFQKDRAAIQYDHPFARALWPFFSYMNALYNAQRDVGHRVARAETAGDYGEAARRAWWVFVVPSLLTALLFEDGPQDNGNGVTVGDWAEYLSKNVILSNLESLPLVGNFTTAMGRGYGYRAISYQQIGDSISKAAQQDKKIYRGEADVSGSSIKNTMEAVGTLFAKPLGQIGATSGGLYDYATGQADPHSAGDWYYLLTRGSIPKQPTAAQRLAGRQ